MVGSSKVSNVLLVVSLAASFLLACTGRLEPTGGDDNGNNQVDADVGPSAEEMQFTATVLPLINSTARDLPVCTTCHTGIVTELNGGTIFGTGGTSASAYDTLVVNARMFASPIETSRVLTRGAHDGNAWCTGAGTPDAYCTVDEVTIISDWITAEVAAGRIAP